MHTLLSPLLLLLLRPLISSTLAREITFPPSQHPLFNPPNSDPDISSSPFYGLHTYANTPYVHCLASPSPSTPSPHPPQIEPYDIAILGAPFDTAVTARPGARFGPRGIRIGSQRLSPDYAWNVETGKNVFQMGFRVVDCGDVPMTVLDNGVALKQLGRGHEIVAGRKSRNGSVPRIIALGGDHTTTLPALRSVEKYWGAVSVIHFDSHLDTWDPEVLGGGISEYAGVNHGTFLHIAHEEGLILNSSVHAGIRAPVSNRKYDLKHDRACGFHIVTARDLDRLGMQGVVDRIRQRVEGTKVYISVDIDVLDPAYAPATGTAEVGGWTTRELLTVLDGLIGLQVVGGDVVEVAPIYDNPGETTVLAGAEVVQSLIGLMVETPVEPKKVPTSSKEQQQPDL